MKLIFAASLLVVQAFACKARVISNAEMVEQADVIVRATATGVDLYSGIVEGIIRFRVEKTLRGSAPRELTLPGTSDSANDFNDTQAPQRHIRAGGRHGDCHASNYRVGQQYLLLLKKSDDGELDIRWTPLAPVNEQLHSDHDPWLLWVRQQTKRRQP